MERWRVIWKGGGLYEDRWARINGNRNSRRGIRDLGLDFSVRDDKFLGGYLS